MSTIETPAPTVRNRPPRNRRGRGGNRGGAAGSGAPTTATQDPNGSLPLRPAAAEPGSTPVSAPAQNPNPNPSRGNRGRRGGRGAPGRGGRRGGMQPMVNGQRAFGGQLTANSPAASVNGEGSLAGDAPVFVPGRPVASRPRTQAPRPRRMSKSQAPDIATRTHEDIANRQYECVICTNEVLSNSKIWTCKSCWSVLHLSCVKRWSKNDVSTHQQRASENEELPPPRQWRCPGCNLPKVDLPETYTCCHHSPVEPNPPSAALIVLDNGIVVILKTGQCEDATSPCAQPCGRKKTNQKQPIKCLASKTSEGNSTKVLSCNEECLKLQRNAKLAAALNIDPATHLDDHIPYSQQTLDAFKDNVKFGQQYEREFRVFAADEKEIRIRFKPMQPQQRAFIHSLAEDFGLDSESQDPEPHRHVCIFKTPRFVSAPMKTLSQCIKVRPVPSTSTEPSTSSKLVKSAVPYNAFLLINPRFGLTIDELRSDIQPEFVAGDFHEFNISFLPSGDVVVQPLPAHFLPGQKLEANLLSMQVAVANKIKSLSLATGTTLCTVDGNLNVLRREDESTAESGGWSQVAKGAARSRNAPVVGEVGVKSSFTVLGTKLAKKMKNEEAVDDWEREVEGWDL
ncbi:uncharacterized protein BP5553_00072 [Venustampulla echinocandica]|uniref:R3H domain-containing protein n=1 Tax=Venustampulla echinocandica TaxID=2656787 RepID=A0A370TX48_9HELO|nr:uncharacterized protein BP5553_00072 [Venustampulla echinocandica]RDL40093.1 hypothetical protein BP5553_00072 [Venustampulla echinocandica]